MHTLFTHAFTIFIHELTDKFNRNEEKLCSDELQFGFKASVGCQHAVFTLRTICEYFNDRGSTVFAAALDISKAFDSVNHSKLIQALIDADVPLWIIAIICNWYGKLIGSIRWNGALSVFFNVCCGVRQGGILSPSLFNIFINAVITDLRKNSIGCFCEQYVHRMHIVC
jgi:retron-type reverse transcriptase